MLRELGFENLDALIDATVPRNIRLKRELNLPEAKSETGSAGRAARDFQQNKVARSFIGAGYSDCIMPPVIQRNILENPAGTRLTRLTRRRSRKAGSKRSSISRR